MNSTMVSNRLTDSLVPRPVRSHSRRAASVANTAYNPVAVSAGRSGAGAHPARHDDIAACEQPVQDLDRSWVLEVERDRLLATVDPDEVGRQTVHDIVVVPREVTAARMFNLDHASAEVGQRSHAERCRYGLLEPDDGQPRQRRCTTDGVAERDVVTRLLCDHESKYICFLAERVHGPSPFRQFCSRWSSHAGCPNLFTASNASRRHSGSHRAHRPPPGCRRRLRRRPARRAAHALLACTRERKFTDSDFDRLNVNRSGISLGHPVGATGARILATLTNELPPVRCPLRPRNDVHRRRSGTGGSLRIGRLSLF
jgi:hypothetical protein